jgi:arginine exporter protein ArgO
MSKTTKDSFIESLKGSSGKIDHKRLTVLAFVLVFIGITIVGLYKKTPIVNQSIIETILYIVGSVILGGMGLTKIKTKTETTTNET